LDLAVQMLQEVAQWLPNRSIQLCADGAYASLASRMLPLGDRGRCFLTS